MTNKIPSFGWNFNNSYTLLPEKLFVRVNPEPVEAPAIAMFNHDLAASLGLNPDVLSSAQGTELLSGNKIAEHSEPIAQAYAGHQFGGFTMLGDGRAILLGEHLTPTGERFDIQLKGSGPTPFSRRGDGRAALGPMLREYIISEAMFYLGIPTTRSLAVVTSGEPVHRETLLPGAVLTRVAASHIRVGTFEYVARALSDRKILRALADYTIARHYPEVRSGAQPYLAFLNAVVEKQAVLISHWMNVGFIHGVMNTDNMAISGETIDYGPCAFMDQYSPATVFSSIDHSGRYAYGNQPEIAQWNLTRFTETLLPLFSDNEKEAVTLAGAALDTFPALMERHWLKGMRAKLGLVGESSGDLELIGTLLRLMEGHAADYTSTFRALSEPVQPDAGNLFTDPEFKQWQALWQSRKPSTELMRVSNPAVIARNHRVEEALSAAVERADFSLVERLCSALRTPFVENAENAHYRTPATPAIELYQTFCGT